MEEQRRSRALELRLRHRVAGRVVVARVTHRHREHQHRVGRELVAVGGVGVLVDVVTLAEDPRGRVAAEAGRQRGDRGALRQVGRLAPRQVVVGARGLLLGVGRDLAEVGEQVVRRVAAAVAVEAGRALRVEVDAGVVDPGDRHRGCATGDHVAVDRRDDADVAGAHGAHRAGLLGQVGVVERREAGHAALDQLLDHEVGRAEPDLGRAGRRVVHLEHQHRVPLGSGLALGQRLAGEGPGVELGGLAGAAGLVARRLRVGVVTAPATARQGQCAGDERGRQGREGTLWIARKNSDPLLIRSTSSVALDPGRTGRHATVPTIGPSGQPSLAPPSTYNVWPVM